MSMITATTWVPRGFAATFPTKYEVDEHELARISKLAKLKLDDAKEDFESRQNGEDEDKVVEDGSETETSNVNIKQSHG